ncbi:hypothetical protein Tco_1148535 [Tanacetum coccineum]
MAAHTERTKRFKKSIFKQREEINDRVTEMFRLLKDLTISRTLKKVLVREKASNPITKYVNAISLVKMKKDKNAKNNKVVDKSIIKASELNIVEPIELVGKEEYIEDGTDYESVMSMKEELDRGETKAEEDMAYQCLKLHLASTDQSSIHRIQKNPIRRIRCRLKNILEYNTRRAHAKKP